MRALAYHPGKRTKVLIVLGDVMSSELLMNALKRGRNGFTVAALVGGSIEVNRRLDVHQPDVALVSVQLQDGPQAGFAVLEKLRKIHPSTAIVMMMDSCQPELVVTAFRKGARGVFSRAHSFKYLSKCINAVRQGQVWANNEAIEHVLNTLSHLNPARLANANGLPLLTPREGDVVCRVAEGMKNRDIAQALGVTEHAVRNYLYRIFDKLGVSNRVELVLYAVSASGDPRPTAQDSANHSPAPPVRVRSLTRATA